MLAKLNQSSKKVSRLKKYNGRNKGTGFQFLLRSLERDKENQVPNMLTAHPAQLTHSLFITPLTTMPFQSFTINNKYKTNKADHFIMQNVKILDGSDASISDQNKSIFQKKQGKKRDNSIKNGQDCIYKRKCSQRLSSNKSKAYSKNEISQFFYKMKQYLTVTDELISEAKDSKSKTKAKSIARQLIFLITNLEAQQYSRLDHSVKITSFNPQGADNFNKGQLQYRKIINHLELEKDKLNNLISQHQMTNIKMFIKLNEDESEQIQQCKKQLAFLFEKYKKLQGFIGDDKKRVIQLIKEKEKLSKHCQQLKEQNNQMIILIEKYQASLAKQNDQKISLTMQSFNNSPKKNLNIMNLSKKGQLPNTSCMFSKGELKIQSLNISQNSLRNTLDSSAATKNTTRILRNNEGRIGINLNALLQNMTQYSISKLKQDPKKWANLILQCKQTLIKMKNIIDQQNQQLQNCIRNIQEYKQKQSKKDQMIKNLQSKTTPGEKQLCKTNEKCIRKDKNTLIIQNKAIKQMRDSNLMQIISKQISSSVNDQYRIIAMQALALEQMLNSPKIK